MSHPHFQVFLYEPCIPQNTGNIGRLCVGFSSRLVILGEPAFSLDDKNLRRAGLDYWPNLMWSHERDLSEWSPPPRCFSVSKYATKTLYDYEFQLGDSFLFGKETTGLPEIYRKTLPSIQIPMNLQIRSYNLANSVAIVLAEATRQISQRSREKV